MDWFVLLSKGLFGLAILLAYLLGVIDVSVVTAVILFLLSLNDINMAYSLRKAEVEED